MVLRKLLLVSLLAVANGKLTNTDASCERLCRLKQQECPSPCAPCPSASCPVPVCPPPPPAHCPPLPEIPTCPAPLVNLTCPACPPTPPRSTSAETIPRDYRTIPGLGSYKFFYEKRTWTEAHVICSRDGGYLAIPNTKEEFYHLTNMMEIHDVRIVHVGFHRAGATASFITSLGQPLDTVQHSFWKDQSTDVSKKCVYIGIGSKATFTETCSDNEYFICEI